MPEQIADEPIGRFDTFGNRPRYGGYLAVSEAFFARLISRQREVVLDDAPGQMRHHRRSLQPEPSGRQRGSMALLSRSGSFGRRSRAAGASGDLRTCGPASVAQRNCSTVDSSSRTFARRARLSPPREMNWVISEPRMEPRPAAVSSWPVSPIQGTPSSLSGATGNAYPNVAPTTDKSYNAADRT